MDSESYIKLINTFLSVPRRTLTSPRTQAYAYSLGPFGECFDAEEYIGPFLIARTHRETHTDGNPIHTHSHAK